MARVYRSSATARLLETALPGELIRAVRASELTGSLLVRYRGADPDAVIRRVLEVLGEPPPEVSAEGEAQAVHASKVSPDAPAARDRRVRERPAAEPAPERAWHALAVAEILHELGVDPRAGLGAGEVVRRLERFGANSLTERESRSQLGMLLEQFNSLPVGLLGISAVISVATGGTLDAAVIMGVVLINAAIGFLTERQAERTIGALTRLRPRHVQAVREGHAREVPAEELVPGDVLALAPGAYVAADARLAETRRLTVDESALTGESYPASKRADVLCEDDTPLGDRQNMAHMGTLVTGGSGRGVVVATAADTQLGRIQSLVSSTRTPETPMQRQLGTMGGQLAILSGLVCAGVFAVGILRGQGWVQMLKSSVSLAVAAVPEGLPAVATTTLALGIQRMRRRQVAVRKLEAVETLGSVQVICLDKTGTLTLNRMSVMELYCGRSVLRMDGGRLAGDRGPVRAGDSAELRRLLEVVALCSEAELGEGEELDGSPTENALVEAAMAGGIDVRALRGRYPREQIRYRAEDRPFMSTLHTAGKDLCLTAVKGSPGEVLERCEAFLDQGETRPLDDPARRDIQRANERMAGEALRVLGVAFAEVPRGDCELHTGGLTWLGLIGMADPLRPGMRELIADYHDAGIETVMITGDQSATAYAIGKQLGLSNARELRILDSASLEKLNPDLLAGLVRRVHVFSRVSPAHKLRIVQALQRSGRVVAMTGDGINDGPALKAAEIGIAMGRSGTDVARSVSDVVLEDDNLHTMHEAVRQGRTIYANIRKTIHFLLSTNFTEIEVMLAGVAFGFGQALNPMQLLWINLISDIFPGLALSLEPPEPDAMERGPRDIHAPVIGKGDLGRMAAESALISGGAVASYLYGLSRYGSGPRAGTLVFNTLTVGQLLHALSCRSAQETLFSARRRPPNPYLNWALGGSLAAQGVISSVPAIRKLLGTSPLGLADLGVVAAGAIGPLLVNEGLKERSLRRERARQEAEAGSDEEREEGEPQS